MTYKHNHGAFREKEGYYKGQTQARSRWIDSYLDEHPEASFAEALDAVPPQESDQ